jgi:ATP-dependent RNA helicase DHR2
MAKRRKLQDGAKSLDLSEYLYGKDSAPEFKSTPPPLIAPLLRRSGRLPIWDYRTQIQAALRTNDVLLIVGETGSGKSTQVPQFLYNEAWCRQRTVERQLGNGKGTEAVTVGGIIAITQPRRVAATTLAHRVARELGTPLGKGSGKQGAVGYSVRFEHNVPPGTRIKFLTEGMLLQELLRDSNLRQYSAVIVDEIHERSVDVDVLSGFLKELLLGDWAGRGGVPLKVIVMSATANVERIRQFFTSSQDDSARGPGIQVLQIEGRQHPVDVVHTPAPVSDLTDTLLKTIFRIHEQEPFPGDILAFLTGQEEIEAVQRLIESHVASSSAVSPQAPGLKTVPLFGQLSIEAQQDAFSPLKEKFTRKIVLATNIAETSVTVPGVKYVIDNGKAKVKQFRVRLGMESLLAKPISKSSAVQRTGRAGREAAGKCYRLYTADTFDTLANEDIPEILRIDILGAVLAMKARGVTDILSFPLMDAPSVESLERASMQLHILGALSEDGSISEVGAKIAVFPVSPPLARVLLAAAEPAADCIIEVIDIISCLTSGEDIFHQLRSEEVREEVEGFRKELYRREGDLLTYLTTMQQYTAEHADRTAWCYKRRLNVRNMRQALNIRRQLRGISQKEKLMPDAPPADPQPFAPLPPSRAEVILKCFMKGFVLKTAMLAPDGSYVTTHGKHVVSIHPSSVLHGQKREAIMFLDHVFTQKSYAKKVSAIQGVWVAEALEAI